MIKDWYYYYISYDELKRLLQPSSATWTDDNETRFYGELEAELDKVSNFQQVKSGEIQRRIKISEREVKDVIARAKVQQQPLDEQTPEQQNTEGPSEEDFAMLEEDLSDIIADVHDLAKFVQLNYTGFYKIIKKHDVSRSSSLRPAASLIYFTIENHQMALATGFRFPTQG